MNRATQCGACKGCQHQRGGDHGRQWCYMFETRPSTLPCAQHDKFTAERRVAASFFKRNPALLTPCLIGELAGTLKNNNEKENTQHV